MAGKLVGDGCVEHDEIRQALVTLFVLPQSPSLSKERWLIVDRCHHPLSALTITGPSLLSSVAYARYFYVST